MGPERMLNLVISLVATGCIAYSVCNIVLLQNIPQSIFSLLLAALFIVLFIKRIRK